MTKVNTTTKYGGSAQESRDGFKIAAEAVFTPEQLTIAAGIGLASILYRGGASVINEALGVKSNSKAEYSDEDAAKITTALTKWAADAKESPVEGGFPLTLVVSRHVHGEGQEPKYTDEKKFIARHIEAGDFAQWMQNEVKFPATAADKDSEAVLKAVKAYKQRRLAEL